MRSLYLGCAMYQALHEAFNNVLNPQANTLKYVIGYYCIPLTYEEADVWSSKTEVVCQNHVYTVRSRVSRYVLDFWIIKSKAFLMCFVVFAPLSKENQSEVSRS